MRPVKRKIWSSLSVILAKARLLYASFVSLILQATLWTVVEFGASHIFAGNTTYYVGDKRYEPAIILLPDNITLRNKKIFMSRLGCFLDNAWPLNPNLASCFSCCQYFSRYLQYYIYSSLNI